MSSAVAGGVDTTARHWSGQVTVTVRLIERVSPLV